VNTVIYQSAPWITDLNRTPFVVSSLFLNAAGARNERKMTIRSHVPDGKSLFKVSGNGLGIAREKESQVFHRSPRRHERSQGSGLGLFLVESTASKIGGKIFVKSARKRGTAFKITSPNQLLA
jgi:signal transduction histidine kinase